MQFAKLTLLLERKTKAGNRGDLTSFGYRPVGNTYVFLTHVQSMTRLDAVLSDDDRKTRDGQVTELWFTGRLDAVYVIESPEDILKACGVALPTEPEPAG